MGYHLGSYLDQFLTERGRTSTSSPNPSSRVVHRTPVYTLLVLIKRPSDCINKSRAIDWLAKKARGIDRQCITPGCIVILSSHEDNRKCYAFFCEGSLQLKSRHSRHPCIQYKACVLVGYGDLQQLTRRRIRVHFVAARTQ